MIHTLYFASLLALAALVIFTSITGYSGSNEGTRLDDD